MDYGLWTGFYSEIPTEDAIRRMANIGLKNIEYSYEHILECEKRGDPKRTFKEIRELAASLGLRATQMHGPSLEWTDTYNIACVDDAVRKACIERTCSWIEYCSLLEVPAFVEHPGGPQVSSMNELKKVEEINVDSFRRISAVASELGVKVALENVCDPKPERLVDRRFLRYPVRFGSTIEEIKNLILSVGSDSLSICLDTGHANRQGIRIEDAVRESGSLLEATHINDNDGSGDQHLAPLRGSINWVETIKAFKDIGYGNPLMLEVPGERHDDLKVRDNRVRMMLLIMDFLIS